jgi:hypothetical protein
VALTDKLGTADSAPGNLSVGIGASELVVPVVRVSQFVVERLEIPYPPARISQFVPELLILAPSMARVSQFVPELLILGPAMARVSQVTFETLQKNTLVGGADALGGPWIGDGGGGNIWIE